MRKIGNSLWAYLATVFLGVGLSLAVLPGCGDDTVKTNVDTDTGFFDSDSDSSD